MSLSYDEISEILKLIDNSSCDELIVETADMKLVVRRNGASSGPAVRIRVTRTPRRCCRPPVSLHRRRRERPAQKSSRVQGQIEVVAPMVGTFYRAPSRNRPLLSKSAARA